MPHTSQFLRGHAIRAAAVWNVDGPNGQFVPNITPDPGTGIGKWEKSDVVELLKTGTTPEQSKVKGAMPETIQKGLKYLSDADLGAIADHLFAQSPIVHDLTPKR
jgi:hypothetical protein